MKINGMDVKKSNERERKGAGTKESRGNDGDSMK